MDTLLFEDIATALDYWAKLAAESLTVENIDSKWAEHAQAFESVRAALQARGVAPEHVESVFRESFAGLLNSVLTILDGGTKMAETGRLHLVDDAGNSLGEGLNERFYAHLFETGRMV